MVSNRALLMSTLRQVLDAFHADKLPLTGVMRTALTLDTFSTDQHITSAVAAASNAGTARPRAAHR